LSVFVRSGAVQWRKVNKGLLLVQFAHYSLIFFWGKLPTACSSFTTIFIHVGSMRRYWLF